MEVMEHDPGVCSNYEPQPLVPKRSPSRRATPSGETRLLDNYRESHESRKFVYHNSFNEVGAEEIILGEEPTGALQKEQHRFRAMNYLWCKVGRMSERATALGLTDGEQREMNELARRASGIRRLLIEENMGLVVGCARR